MVTQPSSQSVMMHSAENKNQHLGGHNTVSSLHPVHPQDPQLNYVQTRFGSMNAFSAPGLRPSSSESSSAGQPNNLPNLGSSKGWGGSIWGNGSLSNGFGSTSRDVLRASVAPRNNTNGHGSAANTTRTTGKDLIEGKTGSSALIDSSISENESWTLRPLTANREEQSSRVNSQLKPTENPFSQQRNNNNSNNAGLPAFTGASRNVSASAYSYRPAPINLNAANGSKPQYNMFDTPMSSLGNESAPAVFTKFDRPTKPSSTQAADTSAGAWPDLPTMDSPLDERKSTSGSGFMGLSSAPASRNGSLPPSRHSDIQPPWPSRAEYYQSPQNVPSAVRNASFSASSRPETNYSERYDPQVARMMPQFGQMSINGDSTSPVSQRQSLSGNGTANQSAYVYGTSAMNRSRSHEASVNGLQSDEIEEIERAFPASFQPGYSSASQSAQDGMHVRGAYAAERLYATGNMPNMPNMKPAASFQTPAPYQRSVDQARGLPGMAGFPNVPAGSAPGIYLEQQLRALQMQDAAQQYWMDPRLLNSQLRNQYTGIYPYGYPNGQGSHMNGYSSIPHGIPMAPMSMSEAPKGPRELESGQNLRSVLLEDFKNNSKTNKRFELKDIYDHVVEFSGDQHGSRFIQQKLETANSDEKERIFREIQPNAFQLMQDVFGNYVIQKFFEHGDQIQKKILANKMKGQVLELSLQMYGCRVVQKALEHILNDQQALLIRELEQNVLRCVKDQNGNHVIQKAIERCEAKDIAFILQAFTGQIPHLSIHTYGCRVIQRCLEHCEMPAKQAIMAELHDGMAGLIGDNFGNYVVQHVVEHGGEYDKQKVLDLVAKGLEGYSKHKFASNVVEKCLNFASNAWKREVVDILVRGSRREGEDMLICLIKDNFGNYVIQKLLDVLGREDYMYFVDFLQPEMIKARRAGGGKQLVSVSDWMLRRCASRD